MIQEVEHFSDDDLSLLKGMIEIHKAKVHLELARIGRGILVTSFFDKYIHRLSWIIYHVKSKQDEDSRKIFDDAVLNADTFKYDDILTSLINMDQDKVDKVRKVAKILESGEDISFPDEQNDY